MVSKKSKSVVDLDIGQGLIDSLGFVVAFGAPCRARLFLVISDMRIGLASTLLPPGVAMF